MVYLSMVTTSVETAPQTLFVYVSDQPPLVELFRLSTHSWPAKGAKSRGRSLCSSSLCAGDLAPQASTQIRDHGVTPRRRNHPSDSTCTLVSGGEAET